MCVWRQKPGAPGGGRRLGDPFQVALREKGRMDLQSLSLGIRALCVCLCVSVLDAGGGDARPPARASREGPRHWHARKMSALVHPAGGVASAGAGGGHRGGRLARPSLGAVSGQEI